MGIGKVHGKGGEVTTALGRDGNLGDLTELKEKVNMARIEESVGLEFCI